MGSSKIFRLFFASSSGDKNTPLTAGEVAGKILTEIPLTSQLGDLNITTGENLEVQNIGGKLKSSWTKQGSSMAQGSFKVALSPSTVTKFWSALEKSHSKEFSGFDVALSGALASNNFLLPDNADTQTLVQGNIYAYLDTDGKLGYFYVHAIDGATGELTCKYVLQTASAPTTLASTLTVVDLRDITRKDDDTFYTFVALTPNGFYFLLECAKMNFRIGNGTDAGIMEAEVELISLFINPDNHTSVIQTALGNLVDAMPTCLSPDTDFFVQRYGSCLLFPASNYIEESATVALTVTDMLDSSNGLIDFELMHERTMTAINGSAQFNGVADIKETENSIKFKLTLTEKTGQEEWYRAKKAGELVSIICTTFDQNYAVILQKCQIDMITAHEDRDGMHTYTVELSANLLDCFPTYQYLEQASE